MARRRELAVVVVAIAMVAAASAALVVARRRGCAASRSSFARRTCSGVVRGLADLDASSASEHGLTVPTRRRSRCARALYEPGGAPSARSCSSSGLNPAGIDEPRLIGSPRQLAASGVAW